MIRDLRGASMVEYVVMAVLVTVIGVAVLALFGPLRRKIFSIYMGLGD